jgi:hypothetical protein
MATVITNGGEEWVVDKLKETVSTEANYGAWGTGAGTAAKADTDLFTPVNTDPGNVLRLAGTTSKQGSGATAKYRNVFTLQAVSGITVTNAGTWTAVSAGTLVVKGDFTGVALSTGDQIVFTVEIDPS